MTLWGGSRTPRQNFFMSYIRGKGRGTSFASESLGKWKKPFIPPPVKGFHRHHPPSLSSLRGTDTKKNTLMTDMSSRRLENTSQAFFAEQQKCPFLPHNLTTFELFAILWAKLCQLATLFAQDINCSIFFLQHLFCLFVSRTFTALGRGVTTTF